ncbi:MAG: AAA family ATPase, partial [Spirochaetaceae bacterium]|nr:AAA family ATPase [Spirochaetaceae bacterium]
MSASVGFFYTQLPWNFISKFHEGVVIQKDGILQRTFAYRGPDLDSSAAFYINDMSIRFNDCVKRLGGSWALQFEAQRTYTQAYPGGTFENLAPYLVDREREDAFGLIGAHFESSYFLTFIYKPPSENIKKLTSMFIQSSGESSQLSVEQNIKYFIQETNTIIDILRTKIQIDPLDNEQTVAYLHSSISTNRHYIKLPEHSIRLDKILPDQELITSLTMKLGEQYIPIIGVNDFPEATYPAILDNLNRALLEYRWVTRFICTDKEEGKKEAEKKEKAHRGNRTSFFQHLFAKKDEPVREKNHGAAIKEDDAALAGIEIETDISALGYYTSNVMVWDKSLAAAKKKSDMVKAIINSAGFTCKEETFNALEAFKSMMPGQVHANFRAVPILTTTLAHIVPLSSIWSGMEFNRHAGEITGCDTPHLICSTNEGTPFFLNINPTDVGHTTVWGPTGAGKSTFLNLLELQFFKYPASQIIVFDKGRSCRLPCLASGGLFYEPAAENAAGVSFQPLRELESERDITFAVEFIEALLRMQKYTINPIMSKAIKDGIELLKNKAVEARTLTSFVQYTNYMDEQTKQPIIKDGLSPYTLGGAYARVFDNDSSDMSLDSRFIAFEMEYLMGLGEACVLPALVYLFYFIEKKFDGRLTMLVLDEAWLFLKHPVFADKITEWLKTLRKKNVFVVFATQDVADVVNSPLKTTIIQQCLTKIYLADPMAATEGMIYAYKAFGLSDPEILCIANAQMKKDYYYTSPLGSRLFQLNLGKITLSLIGTADHKMLDSLVREHPLPAYDFCAEILDKKGVHYQHLLDANEVPKTKTHDHYQP